MPKSPTRTPPAAIRRGPLIPVPVKLATTPAGVISPIELFPGLALVNHTLPSGPAASGLPSVFSQPDYLCPWWIVEG